MHSAVCPSQPTETEFAQWNAIEWIEDFKHGLSVHRPVYNVKSEALVRGYLLLMPIQQDILIGIDSIYNFEKVVLRVIDIG